MKGAEPMRVLFTARALAAYCSSCRGSMLIQLSSFNLSHEAPCSFCGRAVARVESGVDCRVMHLYCPVCELEHTYVMSARELAVSPFEEFLCPVHGVRIASLGAPAAIEGVWRQSAEVLVARPIVRSAEDVID